MRNSRCRATTVAAMLSLVVGGCAATVNGYPLPADTLGPPPPPISVSALGSLLLDVDQINTAFDVTGMKVIYRTESLPDWSKDLTDQDCLAVNEPAQQNVYTGTGYTAARAERLDDNTSDDPSGFNHWVLESVVAFASAEDATAFFNASSTAWTRCAQRKLHVSRTDGPDAIWAVQNVSDDNGMLSTHKLQEGSDGWSCQRALTVTNNVSIDVMTCNYDPASGVAVDIAHQIAAKVTKR
jgi:hypothetical protein